MPSTYAHYIFGQQIRGRLSGYERKVIDKYPELFNIGLHGPDRKLNLSVREKAFIQMDKKRKEAIDASFQISTV